MPGNRSRSSYLQAQKDLDKKYKIVMEKSRFWFLKVDIFHDILGNPHYKLDYALQSRQREA